MTLAVIVALGFASYRLARALVDDSIADPWQKAIRSWAWDEPSGNVKPRSRGRARGWLYELASCQQCVGFWVSLLAVALFATVGGAPPNLAGWAVMVFGVAGVQSVLASVTGRLDSS